MLWRSRTRTSCDLLKGSLSLFRFVMTRPSPHTHTAQKTVYTLMHASIHTTHHVVMNKGGTSFIPDPNAPFGALFTLPMNIITTCDPQLMVERVREIARPSHTQTPARLLNLKLHVVTLPALYPLCRHEQALPYLYGPRTHM